MREIRFRGKRLDNGEWVYGYLIGKDVIVGDIVEFCEEYFNCEYWWRVDPETVGQSSGQSDKNKTEIYRKDIIKVTLPYDDVRIGVVDFEKGAFVLRYLYKGKERTNPLYRIFEDVEDGVVEIEILGNIHDHPHLLKGDGNE